MSEEDATPIKLEKSLLVFAAGSLMLAYVALNGLQWWSLVYRITAGTAASNARTVIHILGWLLIAIAVWMVANSQRGVESRWADPSALMFLSVGAALRSLAVLVDFIVRQVFLLSQPVSLDSAYFDLIRVANAISIAAFVCFALGSAIAARRASRGAGEGQRWARPWWWVFTGTVLIGATYATVLSPVWMPFVDSRWYFDTWWIVFAIGYVLIGVAIEFFIRAGRANLSTRQQVALHLSAVAAVLFIGLSLWALWSTTGGPDSLLGLSIEHWLDATSFFAWLAIATASIVAFVDLSIRRDRAELNQQSEFDEELALTYSG